MAKTKAPSGLTIKRNGRSFSTSWKCADANYSAGQVYAYHYGYGWKYPSISAGTRSKALTNFSLANWYPYTETVKGKTVTKKKLKEMKFAVKGRRSGYEMSAFSYKSMTINPPKRPSLSITNPATTQTRFAWSVATSTTDSYWFTRVQYQSVLKKNCNITDGSQISWTTTEPGSTKYDTTVESASGSLTITEDSSMFLTGDSYTRWFRVRAQGAAGNSDWRYGKHVYADPSRAIITDHKVVLTASKYDVKVWFDTPKTAARPIDEVTVEWSIEVPGAGMTYPSGADSWTTAVTMVPKDSTSGATFDVGQLLADDECLFVRITTKHDESLTYGEPALVRAGKLAQPTITSITPNETTYQVTVVADNSSSVPDSFMVVRYYDGQNPNGFDVAIIPNGETTATGVQCPQWSSAPRFGVYAAVGTYSETTRADGVSQYTVDAKMTSPIQTQGGSIPAAPENVTASQTATPGTIRVTWDWTWEEADSAELSWADHEDAWESTDEPETFEITKLYTAAWNISGLLTGKTWFVRVRLLSYAGDAISYGAYSNIVSIDLSSAPLVPVLTLSDGVITESGQVTASWTYSTTDGTPQAFAEIAEVTEEEGELIYTSLAQVETAQNITLDATEQGWTNGNNYALAVRVISGSGRASDSWSDPVTLAIAEPPTCEITETSLGEATITSTDTEGQPVSETVTALLDMPLTITASGAGSSDITRIEIERAAAYHVDRPDETDLNGFEGETIAIQEHTGDAPFAFALDDLIGRFDDGAQYRIIATVQDGLGQSASDSIEFQVVWSQQALAPTATVEMDAEHRAAILTPIAPEGAEQTDVCDIYRISADKPQLIYEGAEFGESYVDPYPTIGEFGGHRFVTRTANGDYITAENEFAWFDTGAEEGDELVSRFNIIDFDSGQAQLVYNAEISNAWRKEFKETRYLGGSIQGDWNKAVSRSSSLTVTAVTDKDQELIETMRRLADNTGICHVRTKDGSSYAADVQVNETYNYAEGVRTNNYSLTITRIDPEELDGMTLQEWQDLHEE